MFDQYFDVFLADTPAGRDINYQLRYKVYCTETRYENADNFPDRRESDEYDPHSIHFIVKSRTTQQWIAAVRLVVGGLPDLPINRVAAIDNALLLKHTGAKSLAEFSLCGEISRLCVVSSFRRRTQERAVPFQIPWAPNENMSQTGGDAAQERRKAPWLMLALLYAARDYSETHGIHHWFFLTPNSLARIFKGLGMQLEVTGPACEHRGTRYPHVIKIPSGFDNFELKYPALGQTIPRFNRYQLFSKIEESTRYNTAI